MCTVLPARFVCRLKVSTHPPHARENSPNISPKNVRPPRNWFTSSCAPVTGARSKRSGRGSALIESNGVTVADLTGRPLGAGDEGSATAQVSSDRDSGSPTTRQTVPTTRVGSGEDESGREFGGAHPQLQQQQNVAMTHVHTERLISSTSSVLQYASTSGVSSTA